MRRSKISDSLGHFSRPETHHHESPRRKVRDSSSNTRRKEYVKDSICKYNKLSLTATSECRRVPSQRKPLHFTTSTPDLTLTFLWQANPKLAQVVDDDSRLPIHWACAHNHLPIITLLMNTKSFDPDVQDGSGWTPLMIACSLKDGAGESIVDLLLQKDADINMQSFSGQTALHFASSKDNLDIARKLIAQKASARVKDKRGQLALHRAAAVGSVPILRLLLENKSPVNGTDMDGMTALHHAISEGHGQAALELLKTGAEAGKENVDGRRAIDMAPDSKASLPYVFPARPGLNMGQVRNFVTQEVEREGIDL